MPNSRPNTAFIIRMHFAKNDKRWPWRFYYFASMVLPTLLAQRDQDFDICIRANTWHKKQLEALHPKIRVFTVKAGKEHHVKPGYEEKIGKYFVDFVDFEDCIGLERYDIQIGIDSDDMLIRTTFIDRIREEISLRAKPGQSIHIGFQPYIFTPYMLRTFKCNFHYNEYRGSPIFALYQPKDLARRYMYAYEDSHLKLPSYFDESVRIDPGYCAYSVHDANSSTTLARNSRQIML